MKPTRVPSLTILAALLAAYVLFPGRVGAGESSPWSLERASLQVAASAADANPGAQPAASPRVGHCSAFPSDNIWNIPVDSLPVDSHSDAYVSTIGPSAYAHPDFGSGLWDGGPIGIPYVSVPGTQPKVPVVFDYADESDPGPYPIPRNPPIEGGRNGTGDRHVLIVDKDHCILYELYHAYRQSDGSWEAGSGAVFDLSSNALRPRSWTSADAAGLPIFPGLVRYNEVASGQINHAIRFTAPQTRKAFTWPARHYASDLTGSRYPPMGQRFRLKADFDISGFSSEVQVILRALKKYGMILADNGAPWYLSGVPDSRWNNDNLHELQQVLGSNFEAVDVSSLMIDPDSARSRTVVSIVAADPAASELPGDTGKFQIWRIGDLSVPLTVKYTVSGTAVPASDYSRLSGTATILAGRARAAILVKPKADGVREAAETVVVTLSQAAGYVVGLPASATVVISADQ